MRLKNHPLKLLLVIVFAFSAAHSQSDIAIVESIDDTRCTYKAQHTCTTQKKKKTHEKCDTWHIDKARDVGANTILITDESSTESRRPHYDGTYKTIRTTNIVASYYLCSGKLTEENAPALTEEPPVSSAPKSTTPPASIEERLIRLQSLYKKGLITEAEYKHKRSAILSEL
ncbi:Short C-terminal domain-containing protein [Alteromonadaceae bacterium Bs31]|nr:Short C-terminal domain-containing protein [Alteromonadaceae bacterium Bs31]